MPAPLSTTSVQGPWTWHVNPAPASRATVQSACRQPAGAWRCPKLFGPQRVCRRCDCPCSTCASMSPIWTIYMTGLLIDLWTTDSFQYQCSYCAQSALRGNKKNLFYFISLNFPDKILLHLCYFLLAMGRRVWRLLGSDGYCGCRKDRVIHELNIHSKEVRRLMPEISLL